MNSIERFVQALKRSGKFCEQKHSTYRRIIKFLLRNSISVTAALYLRMKKSQNDECIINVQLNSLCKEI